MNKPNTTAQPTITTLLASGTFLKPPTDCQDTYFTEMTLDTTIKSLSLAHCQYLTIAGIKAAFKKLPNLVSLDVARLSVQGLFKLIVAKLKDKDDPLKDLFITVTHPDYSILGRDIKSEVNLHQLVCACPKHGRILVYNPEALSEEDKKLKRMLHDFAALKEVELTLDDEQKSYEKKSEYPPVPLTRSTSAPVWTVKRCA